MAIYDTYDRAKAFVDGPFAGLCTPAEFAEIQGIDESAVRHAIRSGRFIPGTHCLKLGKQWVLCSDAFRAYNGDYSKLSNTKTKCRQTISATENYTVT